MRKRRIITLTLTLLLVFTLIGTAFGAYLTYKSYVEIYGVIYPLGEVEIDLKQIPPIEGLEAREDYLGQIHAWTYSNDTELILQLAQVSQIITNFREFTIKIFQPLDMIFVIDLTGSMTQYIDQIKTQLNELITLLSITHKAPLKFGIVGFKDKPAETIKLPLTDDYETVKICINNLVASGGGHAPQSHYLGLQAAKNEFNTNSKITNEKVVVFFSDAEAGKDDKPSFTEAKAEADEMAEKGIKIDAVLCGSDTPPQNEQLQYYAEISGGQYIGPEGQDNILNGVLNHVTWKIILTPITPFDSFQLRLASSPPCQKKGHYTFYIYLSFYANAFPWHDQFFVELMANLEKGQSRWPSNPGYDFWPDIEPDPDPELPDPPTGLAKLQDKLINAPTNTVYFIYADPAYMTRAEATYDVASGEIVRNLCTNTQHYGFNTTKYWLLPSGAINSTTIQNATIAMFGGRGPNVAVRYYEEVANLTPVLAKANDTYVWFENRTGTYLGGLPWSTIKLPNYHEDMFTAMVFNDGDNTFFIMYGIDWKGTWAGGIFFKEIIYPNLNTYTDNYYVFHWIDDSGQDGIPQASEITLIAWG